MAKEQAFLPRMPEPFNVLAGGRFLQFLFPINFFLCSVSIANRILFPITMLSERSVLEKWDCGTVGTYLWTNLRLSILREA